MLVYLDQAELGIILCLAGRHTRSPEHDPRAAGGDADLVPVQVVAGRDGKNDAERAVRCDPFTQAEGLIGRQKLSLARQSHRLRQPLELVEDAGIDRRDEHGAYEKGC